MRFLQKEVERMQREIFEAPPTTWELFQQRLGQWQTLIHIRDEVSRVSQITEEELDKT